MTDEHARGEKVELELDSFVAKRDAQRRRAEGERPVEEMWMESERRYDERRRADNRAAWVEFHRSQAARLRSNLQALIEGHETQAARLCEGELTKGA